MIPLLFRRLSIQSAARLLGTPVQEQAPEMWPAPDVAEDRAELAEQAEASRLQQWASYLIEHLQLVHADQM